MKWSFIVVALMGCSSQASSTGITEQDLTCSADSTLTYANFAKDLVATNCLSCHGGRQSPNLSTQAALVANKSRILSQAVYSDAMPQDGSLTLDQRKQLGRWISCGAP